MGEIKGKGIQRYTPETKDFTSSSVEKILSEIGKIAHKNWLSIPNHFPFVKLGNHIVMPNHIHGIIIIDKVEEEQPNSSENQNRFGPQSKNIASIIRGYKASVKRHATINGINFSWQPRYHDKIIRDEKAYRNISKYIADNPRKWLQTQSEKDPG